MPWRTSHSRGSITAELRSCRPLAEAVAVDVLDWCKAIADRARARLPTNATVAEFECGEAWLASVPVPPLFPISLDAPLGSLEFESAHTGEIASDSKAAVINGRRFLILRCFMVTPPG